MNSLPNMISRVRNQSRIVSVKRVFTHLQDLVTLMISMTQYFYATQKSSKVERS